MVLAGIIPISLNNRFNNRPSKWLLLLPKIHDFEAIQMFTSSATKSFKHGRNGSSIFQIQLHCGKVLIKTCFQNLFIEECVCPLEI